MHFCLESLIERISLIKFIYQQRLLPFLLLTMPCKYVKYERFRLFNFLFEQSLIEQNINFFCFLHTSVFDNKEVFIGNIILSLHKISEFLTILLGLRHITVSLLIHRFQGFDLIVYNSILSKTEILTSCDTFHEFSDFSNCFKLNEKT